ncbi:MAG: DNA primase [Sphingobacteriaceae bacterium]|nr:DNA primase [Sphingobacteriaceae bacterium]
MISRSTIDRVMDTARIEEVVGDFVTLKKRGGNYIGLCPFHNEKSPSFTVTPAKGIYKCFGCGASGNSVGFLMEHEHLTYPDAIRQLAQRYNLEVEEETRELSEQHKQELSERDRQYALHAFAQQYFHLQLTETDDGKAIGLSYFKERGITDESIEKFGLGYSPDSFDALSRMALTSDFSQAELEASGLSIHTQSDKIMDRFRGRVIFPFYNLSGKVIGFGGRILKNDKKEAKYLNSPETLLYKKSETLYGLFQAKKAIQKNENCYLVEGYTDVIGLHQAGIENVAASSGTSLTHEQARLIHRFSKKVTVIYDGDAAGIKASLRGINILLENNLQVSVVPLPEGEDPDSYSRQLGGPAFRDYLAEQTVDFVRFKVNLLLTEAAGDPMKRAEVIHDMAETVSFIGDPIVRATYSSSTAAMLDITEQLFIQAVQQHHLNRMKRVRPSERESIEAMPSVALPAEPQSPVLNDEPQEADIIRILLHYAQEPYTDDVLVIDFVVNTLDELSWDNAPMESIFRIFEKSWKEEQRIADRNDLFNHPDKSLAALALHIYSIDYSVSENWEKRHDILTPSRASMIHQDVSSAVDRLNLKKVISLMNQTMERLKHPENEESAQADLEEFVALKEVHRTLAQKLGTHISH